MDQVINRIERHAGYLAAGGAAGSLSGAMLEHVVCDVAGGDVMRPYLSHLVNATAGITAAAVLTAGARPAARRINRLWLNQAAAEAGAHVDARDREAALVQTDHIKRAVASDSELPLTERYIDALRSRGELEDFSAQLTLEKSRLAEYGAGWTPQNLYERWNRKHIQADLEWYAGRIDHRLNEAEANLDGTTLSNMVTDHRITETDADGAPIDPRLHVFAPDTETHIRERDAALAGRTPGDIPRLMRYEAQLTGRATKLSACRESLRAHIDAAACAIRENRTRLKLMHDQHAHMLGNRNIARDIVSLKHFEQELVELNGRIDVRADELRQQEEAHSIDAYRLRGIERAYAATQGSIDALHRHHLNRQATLMLNLLKRSGTHGAIPSGTSPPIRAASSMPAGSAHGIELTGIVIER